MQFLHFLPAVPVTFLTPVKRLEGSHSYDGQSGLARLLAETGVPSIRYSDQGGRQERKRKLGE